MTEPASERPAGPATTSRPSELAMRVASGVVMAAGAIALTVLGGPLFGLLWTAAAIVIFREWLGIVGVDPQRLMPVWLIGSIGLAAAGGFAQTVPLGSLLPWIVVLLVAATVALLVEPSRTRTWAAAGLLYAAVIAILPAGLRDHPAFGIVTILWIFAVVWGTDIGAYFVGRAVGGPKLWPAVSPKKTWSGFIGGFVIGSALGVGLVRVLAGHGLHWHTGARLVALTLVASVVSQGGDLLESALKRRFGVKDAGQLIPGHGGVMDRLDSFWAVCLLLGLIVFAAGGVRP
jgi:phosphatidate cytidylyltransferase